jgi:copper resistance protein C
MKLPRALLAAGLGGALCVAAHAHAFLDHAQPRVGSELAAAPADVKLWFTEKLEPAFSTVSVVDANGKRVDVGPPQVDANDRMLLRTALPRLGPGEYTVRWRAVSVDTHATEGRFTFRVGP